MDLKVEGSELQRLLEVATLEALGTVGKELLIKEVVAYLTTDTTRNYGSKQNSPLLDALKHAADRAANLHFQEKLKTDPEFVATLDQLYVDAVKKFTSSESREKLVNRMADRLASAFDKD